MAMVRGFPDLRPEAGLPAPWTDDRILRDYYFTNVYRELDKTTVWFRENVRDPLRDDPRVIFATVARSDELRPSGLRVGRNPHSRE